MYTTTPCNVPSAVPIPVALLNAAASAAQSTVASGGTLQDAGTAVKTAIQNFFSRNPSAPNTPNIAQKAVQTGYETACRSLVIRQMNEAQRQFHRLSERHPSDFAGLRIQTGQFNAPQFGKRGVAQSRFDCNLPGPAPKIVPIESEFNYTPNPAPLTATPVVPVPPIAPAGTPSQPAPSAPSQANCETGNVCIDLRNGCILSSQVDVAQLLACAQAGYVGNLNKYPVIAGRGGARGGAFIGSPMLNPPQFNPGMGALRRNPARPMRRVA